MDTNDDKTAMNDGADLQTSLYYAGCEVLIWVSGNTADKALHVDINLDHASFFNLAELDSDRDWTFDEIFGENTHNGFTDEFHDWVLGLVDSRLTEHNSYLRLSDDEQIAIMEEHNLTC